MAQFKIREENLERLEKKLETIAKKCEKSNFHFRYEITGEEFINGIDNKGREYSFRYILVDVEGEVKYEGWSFVATLDHHKEGNIIRAFNTDLVIPDRYKTCGPTCEHCNKIRSRKDTYLVYNENTNEFKQVGKNCLQEFTGGISAEDAAFFVSVYEKMEEGYGYTGTGYKPYTSVEETLRYAFECYRIFGYQKSETSLEEIPVGYKSTRSRVADYRYANSRFGKAAHAILDEMKEIGFNENSEYAVENTKAALEWIRTTEEWKDNEYLRSLHIICKDDYTEYRNVGILVSLTIAYNRHLNKVAEYEEKKAEEEKVAATSNYVGEKGERINVATSNFELMSSWDGFYGMTFLYKFTDDEGNVFVWYASKSIDTDSVSSVTGTVKEHSEFRGIKQTVLTRCKVA